MKRIVQGPVVLLFAATAVAGQPTWRPIQSFSFPAPLEQAGEHRRVVGQVVAPDAGVIVFGLRWDRKTANTGRQDLVVGADLTSGKELFRLETSLILAGLVALSPDGLDWLMASPCPGFSCDELSLWSRTGEVRAIPGPGGLHERRGTSVADILVVSADAAAFGPGGQRLAVRGVATLYAASPDDTAPPNRTREPAIVVLGLDGKKMRWFPVPPEETGKKNYSWPYAWRQDGASLFVALPQDDHLRDSSFSVSEAWQQPFFILYRLDLEDGGWHRLCQLPYGFAGFGGGSRVIVWESSRKAAFAAVPIELLESVHADGAWWDRYRTDADFECVVPAALEPEARVDRLFLGDRRAYALILRKTAEYPSGVPEIWKRADPTGGAAGESAPGWR
jgi:hypothetical protein